MLPSLAAPLLTSSGVHAGVFSISRTPLAPTTTPRRPVGGLLATPRSLLPRGAAPLSVDRRRLHQTALAPKPLTFKVRYAFFVSAIGL